MQYGLEGMDPITLMASVPQLDDAGANTADRYDWQAAMAAADGLALLLRTLVAGSDLSSAKVVCELHEDWSLISSDGIEVVSGKHREPSVGPYSTYVKLLKDGGLAHLFNRWAALTERPTCRLVTSGGLSGTGEPKKLMTAVEHFKGLKRAAQPVTGVGTHTDVVSAVVTKIPQYCDQTKSRWDGDRVPALSSDERKNEVARFLAALTVDENRPHRDYVADLAPSRYVKPVLDSIGVSTAIAVAVWEAVLDIFRARMRSRGPLPGGGLPVIFESYRTGSVIAPELERAIDSRTVTMEDLDIVIRTASSNPAGFEPVPRLPLTSRLEVKMDQEQCSDNTIQRALALRQDYLDYWRERESGDPTARAERRRLERRLQQVSDSSTSAPGRPPLRGTALWRQFEHDINALPEGVLPLGMDPDLALGGMCQLAEECKVWFGQRFDAATVLAANLARDEDES